MAFEGIPAQPSERPTTTVQGFSLSVGDKLVYGGEVRVIKSIRNSGQDMMVTLEKDTVITIDHDDEYEVVT